MSRIPRFPGTGAGRCWAGGGGHRGVPAHANARDNRHAPKDAAKPFAVAFTDIQSSTSLWSRDRVTASWPPVMGPRTTALRGGGVLPALKEPIGGYQDGEVLK